MIWLRRRATSQPARIGLPGLAACLALIGGCSDPSGDTPADAAPTNPPSTPALAGFQMGAVGSLDSTTVHTLSLDVDEVAYEAMIAKYLSTEEKEWVEATVTIDGVTYQRAGIRLKGSSSLRGIGRDGPSPESPETLPWLVALDKYVDEQNHEGLTELVVRSNGSATSLNEAVALELLDLAGLASQDAVAARFSVNGSEAILRLVIDNPEDEWMAEEFDSSGALYKAESTGDYEYRGTDPESYKEVFDQEAGKDNADIRPLIEFLEFVNESDDATFAAELPQHLDVEKFAIYLAMQDLLDNFDDIDGPGNNSYLYYDTTTDQFTVVPWDYNLAFGVGPTGTGRPGMGGRPVTPEGPPPEPPPDVNIELQTVNTLVPPDGAGGGGGGFGGPGEGTNILVDRFVEVEQWQALYEDKLTTLRTTLFEGGVAAEVLRAWTGIIESSSLVDAQTVAAEAAQIAGHFT